MTQGILYLDAVPTCVPDRQEFKAIELNACGPTHNQISLEFPSGLEANLARVGIWEGLYHIVQDELDVPGLEQFSDHLAELDGVRLVENKSLTVNNGNLLGLWGGSD
jgi:hypothetical protein